MTNAVTTRQPNTLDADAGRLIRYLQRGGTNSYYTTFDADGNARQAWYDTNAPALVLPTGTNVYFGVNPCTSIPKTNKAGEPRRPTAVRARKEYIAALNCLYAEFDAKDFGGELDATLAHVLDLTVPPSVIVASGGGYHCYWLLDEPFMLDTDDERARAVDVQARWTTFVRGDKAAKDIARVLRVPGTLNYKYEPARPVAFVEQDYTRTYTLDELQATLPAVAPRTARTAKSDAPACHTDSLQPGVAQPSVDFAAISKAAAAMHRLSPARRDDYDDWLHVGMALRELGAIGYEFWHHWSASSPKHQVGDCKEKWPTFQPGAECNGYTLASLFAWARDDGGEPVRTLDDAERLQLQDLQARDIQTQKILGMKAPLAAKAVWVGMLPRLDVKRVLVADKAEHSGSLAVNCGTFADVLNTSDTSVGKYIELGEQAGLWRKDAEYKQTKSGYDIKLIRLDVQLAFFRPELAQPLELKPRGGKRAGAGRKPKCADCPPRTRVVRKTDITYVCDGCGQVLDAEPTRYDVMPDDAPAAAEFKHETGYATPAGYETDREPVSLTTAGLNVETNAPEFKHETEKHHADAAGTTTASCLKKTRDELVPVALTETFDIPAAIRLADSYAPADATERNAYKTALVWLGRGEHEKAATLASRVHDERAHAVLAHLANRPPTLAPA
jgi:hypothetical protein